GVVGFDLGRHDLDAAELIAARPLAVLDAPTAEAKLGAARRPGRYGDCDASLDGGDFDLRAQGRFDEADREIELDVGAAPSQVWIGADLDVQVEIPGRPVARRRGRPLPGETQPPAVLHARRNVDLDGRSAPGADGSLAAQRRLDERDLQPPHRVGAACLARADAARVEAATRRGAAADGARAAERLGERVGVEPFGHPVGPDRGVLETVVFPALLGIAEDVVRLVDLLEAFGLALVAASDVGVVLLGELAIGLLDRSLVRVLRDPQRL